MEESEGITTFNKNHICEICEKVYTTKKNLKNHFTAAHDENRKVFNCNICTKSFHKQNSLKVHTKTVHKSYKDYKCESCGKLFSEARA